jgi:hypothetical protein
MARLRTAAIVLAAACASAGPGIEAPEAGVKQLTLTAARSSDEMPVAPLPAAPQFVELPILRITNPDLRAFSVRLSVRWTAGGSIKEITVGSVSPYPPDRAGTFSLPVSAATREGLLAKGGAPRVRFSLEPLSVDQPLSPALEVQVGAPSWRSSK